MPSRHIYGLIVEGEVRQSGVRSNSMIKTQGWTMAPVIELPCHVPVPGPVARMVIIAQALV